ncbi:Ras-related protein Rab-24 [Coccomyxa sp. Obi]|nr:Ras-related protein Rab-24 [Coccomyxa sp. Obi]
MAKVDVKVVLLGQQSVGKSCLVDRYINSIFELTPKNTIGAAFAAKKIKVHSGRVVSLGIWDTAGAERFESLSRMYYNGAKAAILCFDPCDRKSFDKLKFWVEEVRETQPDCRIYIALTKCDQLEELPSVGTVQPDPEVDGDDSTNGGASSTRSRQLSASSITSTSGRREVSDEDVAEYAKQLVVPHYGAPRVFVTSAKQGIGVHALFQTVAEDMAGVSPEQRQWSPEVRPTSPSIRAQEFRYPARHPASPSSPTPAIPAFEKQMPRSSCC